MGIWKAGTRGGFFAGFRRTNYGLSSGPLALPGLVGQDKAMRARRGPIELLFSERIRGRPQKTLEDQEIFSGKALAAQTEIREAGSSNNGYRIVVVVTLPHPVKFRPFIGIYC